MSFIQCIKQSNSVLMEGALGERLKREYGLIPDKDLAWAKLVYDPKGRLALRCLWLQYIKIAQKYALPFLATTPTRRANCERVKQAGYDTHIIADNVRILRNIQQESDLEMYIGGLMGCVGDAYTGENALSEEDAYNFHRWQANAFSTAGVDFLYAGIMPNVPEAAGIAKAMSDTGIPYIISFTIEKNGRLIDGASIHDAISYIDEAVCNKPICYMTNCVHPNIAQEALSQSFNRTDLVRNRFLGIQANTSPLTYAELDGAIDLKCSESEQFAKDMMDLRDMSKIKIFGGCCGTDDRHMEHVARRL